MTACFLRVLALTVALAGGAAFAAVPAQAQNADTTLPADDDIIIVNGNPIRAENRLPYLQCARTERNTHYRALLAATGGGLSPQLLKATRAPRNPDYSKPPLVAAGSPLPKIALDRRFSRARLDSLNVRADASAIADGVDRGTIASGNAPSPMSSIDSKFIDCAERYGPNRGVDGDPHQLPDGSWMTIGDDEQLPMAIILFDQGRYAEARDWFVAAYKDGYNNAKVSLFLGKIYLEGLGAQSDPVRALRWLKEAATARYDLIKDTPFFDPDHPDWNTNIGEAAVILGNLYAGGLKGFPRDPEQSYRWYKRAYEVGHLAAAKTLGDLHRLGFGTKRDTKAAVSWYRKVAQFGLPSAQVALADLLDTGGQGLRKDRKQALKWYQAAAERDHPDALFALARAYDFGDGVRADPEMALGLYKTAALAGSAPAKTALGTYFHEGRIVAQSEVTARDWFERAAAEQDAEGMFNLAAMMANGQGGERDLTSAWMWLNEAKTRGHDKAPVALAAVEGQMTPAERAALNSRQ